MQWTARLISGGTSGNDVGVWEYVTENDYGVGKLCITKFVNGDTIHETGRQKVDRLRNEVAELFRTAFAGSVSVRDVSMRMRYLGVDEILLQTKKNELLHKCRDVLQVRKSDVGSVSEICSQLEALFEVNDV